MTTYAKIKPRKIYGEKSSVFDLAYHSDINAEINLINNGFENYFDDIEFNTKENCWVNPSINALYNHDARLERDVFIEIYKKRIENFYDYINDNKFLLAVYSTSYVAKYTKEDIENLYDALKKKRGDKKFAFIVINHSQYLKDAKFDMENTLFIDISYFNMDNWADKVRKTKEGKELVKNIGNKIKKFMKSFDL